MAHRIISKPEGVKPSYSLGQIEIEADGNFVDVEISYGRNVVILSERYYAYGGTVILYDIASLIEEEMRQNGLVYTDLFLSVGSDSHTYHILYCDRHAAMTWSQTTDALRENFLTTLSMRRVPPESTLIFSLYAEAGESLAYSVQCDATTEWFDADRKATANGEYNITVTVPEKAKMITVRCGQRSLSCFVDNSLSPSDGFAFRNCFNAWEMLYLPFQTTAKTDVEQSMASVNGVTEIYNQSVTKNYEVTCGSLTSDEAQWIDQFISSHKWVHFEVDTMDINSDDLFYIQVILSDSTCEISDSDEKPNTIKFTWRYADNRPSVRLSASPGIFNQPFNPVYS